MLDRLRQRLAKSGSATEGQDFAVVFLPAVLWSRYSFAPEQPPKLSSHADGPQPGDVVMVTEPEVLRAWMDRRLSTRQLLDGGLVRLYGDAAPVERMTALLHRLGSAAS